MAKVRISGNWRSPSKNEWIGAPEIGEDGRIDRSVEIPESAFEAMEREIARGGREGMIGFSDGRHLNWTVD